MSRSAKVVIVGESLLAREIRDVFSDRDPHIDIETAGIVEDETILTEREGEPSLIMGINKETLSTSDVIILAGPPAASHRVLEMWSPTGESPPTLIDLSYALEDQPHARLRAPRAEPAGEPDDEGGIYLIAHPAAIILSSFFRALHVRFPLARWLVHGFEPASERGKPGVDELQQQTVELFSFRALPKQVFDEQLTFNMLARYGDEAPDSLQGIEARIERHLASLLAKGGFIPMPSLRLIQAPVFHGYSFSVWAEFQENPGTAALAEALAAAGVDVRKAGETMPTNVGIAGQTGMAVGLIEQDRNDPRCSWFWIVADNHRTSAENAVALAEQVLKLESED